MNLSNAAAISCAMTHALCRELFPDKGASMASTMFNGSIADVFDSKERATHKYIPAERLTQDLGEARGAGVYGYCKMWDGSYVLLTCNGRLAHWTGGDEAAIWGE